MSNNPITSRTEARSVRFPKKLVKATDALEDTFTSHVVQALEEYLLRKGAIQSDQTSG